MAWPFTNSNNQRFFSIFLIVAGIILMVFQTSIQLTNSVNNFTLGAIIFFIGFLYLTDIQ